MRLELLDNIRGIAFIFMVINHTFLFIYLFTPFNNNNNNIFNDISGSIARNLFIIIFGISLYLLYKKYHTNNKNNKDKNKHDLKNTHNEFKKKYFQKIFLLFISSIYITIISYYFVPDNYIIFGILHFMCLSMLILYPIINNINLLILLLFIILILKQFLNNNLTNNIFNSILGFGIYKSSIDHFKLIKWLDIIIIGILIGYIINNNLKNINLYIKKNKYLNYINNIKLLKIIGQNTLFLYIIHIPILYIIIKSISYFL